MVVRLGLLHGWLRACMHAADGVWCPLTIPGKPRRSAPQKTLFIDVVSRHSDEVVSTWYVVRDDKNVCCLVLES